jgi:hypothetical protein
MNDLVVKFISQTDRENRSINVYKLSEEIEDILIATGSLNLCSNMAHITILPAHKEAYEDMEFDIEKAIEERNIFDNRILIGNYYRG